MILLLTVDDESTRVTDHIFLFNSGYEMDLYRINDSTNDE